MKKQTNLEFFEARVHRPKTPCWNWRAYINRKGYGTWRRDGTNTYVHRVAYELFVGQIPEGFEIHHICCNRSCVNPEHLQLLTHAQNIAAIGRSEFCVNGHPFDGVNARGRYCKTCNKLAGAKIRLTDPNYGRLDRECKNGHPRTPENTEIRGGHRRCRLCRIEGRRKPGGYKDPNRQRATHCPQGHAYTPENTYTHPDGKYRYCRTCNRAAVARGKG